IGVGEISQFRVIGVDPAQQRDAGVPHLLAHRTQGIEEVLRFPLPSSSLPNLHRSLVLAGTGFRSEPAGIGSGTGARVLGVVPGSAGEPGIASPALDQQVLCLDAGACDYVWKIGQPEAYGGD